jgi:hypothetical protein
LQNTLKILFRHGIGEKIPVPITIDTAAPEWTPRGGSRTKRIFLEKVLPCRDLERALTNFL